MPSKGQDGFSSMHYTSYIGRIDIIDYLLQNGGQIDVKNNANITLIHIAAQNDHPLMIAYLVKKGLNLNARDMSYNTPLHCAAFTRSYLSLKFILEWGGEVEAINIHE